MKSFFFVKNCLYLSDFTWKTLLDGDQTWVLFVFFRWWHAFNSKACKCLSMGRVFLKRRKWLHWLDLMTAPYRWFARWPMLSELHVLRRKCTKRGSPRPATPQCTSVCSIHICQFFTSYVDGRKHEQGWETEVLYGRFFLAAWSKVEIRGPSMSGLPTRHHGVQDENE